MSGHHRHVSPQYLHKYADQAAWLEDHRRETNGALASRALGLALAHPVSPKLERLLAAGDVAIEKISWASRTV